MGIYIECIKNYSDDNPVSFNAHKISHKNESIIFLCGSCGHYELRVLKVEGKNIMSRNFCEGCSAKFKLMECDSYD